MSRQEMMYANGLRNDVKLTKLNLHKDTLGYYLHATYMIEDGSFIRQLDIPKIRLRVDPHYVAIRQKGEDWPTVEADIGFGYTKLSHSVRSNAYFTETVIEEKSKEMTLEEIEKKLGHKVKIITKPESRDDWSIEP